MHCHLTLLFVAMHPRPFQVLGFVELDENQVSDPCLGGRSTARPTCSRPSAASGIHLSMKEGNPSSVFRSRFCRTDLRPDSFPLQSYRICTHKPTAST